MKLSLARIFIWMALIVGAGLLQVSCVTTGGNWASDLPETGSAKGGASLLMKR